MPSRTITTPITLEGVATLEDFNAHRDDSSIHFKLAAGDNISIASDATTNTSTVSVPTDQAPVPGSTKPVQSGGVYNSVAYPEVVGSEFIDGADPQAYPYPFYNAVSAILTRIRNPYTPQMSLPMLVANTYSGSTDKKVAALQVKAWGMVAQARTRLFLIPNFAGQGISPTVAATKTFANIESAKYFSSDPQEPVETAGMRDLYLYPNADTLTVADLVGKGLLLGFGESPDKVVCFGDKSLATSVRFALVKDASGDLRKDPDSLYLGFSNPALQSLSFTPIKLILEETVKSKVAALETALTNKQDKLTAGAGVAIDENNVISADAPPQYETDIPDELQHGHVYSVVVSDDVDLTGLSVRQYAQPQIWLDYTSGEVAWPDNWTWVDNIVPEGDVLQAGKSYIIEVMHTGRVILAKLKYSYNTNG